MIDADERDWVPPDDYLKAVGKLAHEWQRLEFEAERAIWALAKVDGVTVGVAITTHIRIKEKLDIIGALAELSVLRRPKTPRVIAVLKSLTSLCNKIDTLSRERNSMIHADWARGLGGLAYPRRMKLSMRRSVSFGDIATPLAEIDRITRDVTDSGKKLDALCRDPVFSQET